MLGVILVSLLIFTLRVVDMSLGTFRIVSSVKGAKALAAAFGFLEAFVFIVALAKVLSPPLHLLEMFAYAGGFAGGTFVGTYITPAAVCLTHGVSLHRGRPDAGNSF